MRAGIIAYIKGIWLERLARQQRIDLLTERVTKLTAIKAKKGNGLIGAGIERSWS